MTRGRAILAYPFIERSIAGKAWPRAELRRDERFERILRKDVAHSLKPAAQRFEIIRIIKQIPQNSRPVGRVGRAQGEAPAAPRMQYGDAAREAMRDRLFDAGKPDIGIRRDWGDKQLDI